MRWLCTLALGALMSGACYSAGDSGELGGTSGNTGGGSASGGTTTSGGTTAGGGTTARGGSSSAGSSSAGSAGVAGTGATSANQCTGPDSVFASIGKTCASADDCVLVNHTADCCGTILIMGISAGALQTFSEAEADCSAQLPACGCAAQGSNLEDGTIIDFDDTSYAVECAAGECGSYYSGVTFPCLDLTCTQTQYCQIVSGGPAGSGATASCFPRGACSDCTCLNAVGCQCSDSGGNITVASPAP